MSEPDCASRPAAADAAAATTKSSKTVATRKRARSTPPKSKRYVDLGEDAPVMSSWKNDPSYMKLETYFSENQKDVPGLPYNFRLKGLKPVLVNPDFEEGFTYLLSDGKNYFMYNEEERKMWRFKNALTQRAVVRKVQGETFTGTDFVEHIP